MLFKPNEAPDVAGKKLRASHPARAAVLFHNDLPRHPRVW